MQDPSQARAAGRLKSIFLVASGNFLEMYDFMVFGYYAKAIGAAFFPSADPGASLLLALMTFGAGFLMRPIGALFLGAYIDRHGRRTGLLLTLGLMGLGTLTIAVMPTYAQIGLAAPALVLVGRLIQGLSAGVEVGGVSVYLSEIAPPGRKGFYVAWQSASQQVAVVFAALVGMVLNTLYSPDDMNAWGWRVPFFIGSVLLPFLLVMRSGLTETASFAHAHVRPTRREAFATIRRNLGIVIAGALMTMMTTVFFYMITAYTPTFGNSVLNLTPSSAMLVTLCVGLTNFILLPVMGGLSDRIGRRPLLLVCPILAFVTGYPAMHWLVDEPSFGRLLAVQVWLAVLYAGYNGALIVYITEIVPPKVRTMGFSLAYSLATAIFGGFTPAIATYLIDRSGDSAAPGLWLSVAALVSCVTVALLPFALRGRPQSTPAGSGLDDVAAKAARSA